MQALTVMTWNVRYFSQPLRGARSTDGALRRAAAAVVGSGLLPDVLALQEVEDTSLRGGLGGVRQLDRFRGALHHALHNAGHERRYRSLYFPVHRYEARGAPPLYTTGLAFLVREDLPVEGVGQQEVTHVRLPVFSRLKQRRIVCWATIGGVTVFNTHLSLPAFFEGGPHTVPARMGAASNQREEVGRLLSGIGDRAGVLVGDFNCRKGSAALQRLHDAGWDNACPEVPGDATASFMRWRMHIDHVFVRGLACTARRGFGIDEDSPFRGLSDHSPKWVAIRPA